MAGRSSISRDPAIEATVKKLIAQGATVDEIASAVLGLGISRSAVGRYVKTYRPLVDDMLNMHAMSRALKELMPEGDATLVDLALHKAMAQAVRQLSAWEEDEDAPPSTKDLAANARTINALVGAKGRKALTEKLIREEARRDAADKADTAARGTGASEATLDAIRRSILGID